MLQGSCHRRVHPTAPAAGAAQPRARPRVRPCQGNEQGPRPGGRRPPAHRLAGGAHRSCERRGTAIAIGSGLADLEVLESLHGDAAAWLFVAVGIADVARGLLVVTGLSVTGL